MDVSENHGPPACHHDERAIAHLTTQECEVYAWLIQGKTNPEIATILNISTRTVEKHLENILTKMRVENRMQLLVQAMLKRTESPS
ncbi:MAG: helix-turn-helix transcriptional regulator [Candidatus Methylacidiphilales bacterium]